MKAFVVLTFLCVQLAVGTAKANIEKLQIIRAWKSGPNFLLELNSSHSERFLSGNRLFWGTLSSAQQLELNSDKRGENGSREIRLVTATEQAKTATLSFDLSSNQPSHPEVIRAQCDLKSFTLTPASKNELEQLQLRLDKRADYLKFLPNTRLLRHLFRVKSTGELVLVTEPAFNFYNNFEVFMGRNHTLRRVPLVKPTESWETDSADHLVFKSGGGLFIPATFSLFGGTRPFKGSPSLIRGANGSVETLVPVLRLTPALKQVVAQFVELGEVTHNFPTPCQAALKL